MQRKAWWFGAVVVLVVASTLVGVQLGRAGRAPAAPVDARDGAPPTTAAPVERAMDPRADPPVEAAASASPAGATATRPVPLPPTGAPLVGIIDDLERRARAGEARAACRLAAEIGRCASLARREAMVAHSLSAPPTPGGQQSDPAQIERFVDLAARQQVELERDQALCAGVPRERLRDAAPWMLAAARAGNEAAMTAFAGGMWMMFDPYAMRHAEVLAAYSREAERMALSLAEAGSPAMVRSLGMAYATGAPGGPLGGVVDPDPVRGHALLRTLLEWRPPGGAPMLPRIAVDSTPAARTLPEQRAFEALDAGLDPGQRAASDALFARLNARRTEYEAREGTRARPGTFINSIIQPDACDR